MKRITIKSSVSMAETFEDFLLSRKAKGLTEKTLTTYKQHFSSVGKALVAISKIILYYDIRNRQLTAAVFC